MKSPVVLAAFLWKLYSKKRGDRLVIGPDVRNEVECRVNLGQLANRIVLYANMCNIENI